MKKNGKAVKNKQPPKCVGMMVAGKVFSDPNNLEKRTREHRNPPDHCIMIV